MKRCILILFVSLFSATHGVTFEEMSAFTKGEIGKTFLSYVSSATPSLIQPCAENIFYETWISAFCGREEFQRLRRQGYFPTLVTWCWGFDDKGRVVWVNEGLKTSGQETSAMHLIEDYRKGLYVPLVSFGDNPLFLFLQQEKKASARESVTYAFITNLTFQIKGLTISKKPINQLSPNKQRIVNMRRNLLASLEPESPPITLTRREATEIVYLTALCRGKVKSLDEFNAAFVPQGETFLVKLTAAECETEIGRMLYKIVRKRGLIPKTKVAE